MRYLIIIIVLINVMEPVSTQDLDAPIPPPVSPTDLPTDPEEPLDDAEEDWFADVDHDDHSFISAEVSTVSGSATLRKEDFLNSLLRQIYYQRETTSPWSQYLNYNSWAANVRKRRYLAQLRDYITSNEKNIIAIANHVSEGARDTVTDVDSSGTYIERTRDTPHVDPRLGSVSMDAPTTPLIDVGPVSTDTAYVVTRSTVHIDPTADTSACLIEDITNRVPTLNREKTNLDVEVEHGKVAENKSIFAEDRSIERVDEDQNPTIAIPEKESEAPAIKEQSNKTDTRVAQVPIKPDPHTPVRTKEESATSTLTPRVTYRASPHTFADLKGALPWPVKGRVTDGYGIRTNAEERGLRPENYGIDMLCPPGSQAKAVHQGTVLMSQRQSPYDIIVTIKHDNFTTAYYYLIQSFVRPGDQVLPGQPIGLLRTSVREADFHFEIWHDQNRVDPQEWLKK